MQMKYVSCSPARSPGLLRKAGTPVATVALAGLALMFSAVLLAFLLCVGAVAFAWLWWKTRKLRRQMRDFPPRGATMEHEVFSSEVFRGEVIEGEAIRVDTKRDTP